MNSVNTLILTLLFAIFLLVKRSQAFLPSDPSICVKNLVLDTGRTCEESEYFPDIKNVKNGKRVYIVCTDSDAVDYKFYICFDMNRLSGPPYPEEEILRESTVTYAQIYELMTTETTETKKPKKKPKNSKTDPDPPAIRPGFSFRNSISV
uniref:14.2 kDa salivary protein n=1 Tax=Lutzomyia longipalpis TaxID=7200 RepID=Q5WPT8_LUTLO|nr:14.2 kDa salivary protein [Lutzomyia longipalpis]